VDDVITPQRLHIVFTSGNNVSSVIPPRQRLIASGPLDGPTAPNWARRRSSPPTTPRHKLFSLQDMFPAPHHHLTTTTCMPPASEPSTSGRSGRLVERGRIHRLWKGGVDVVYLVRGRDAEAAFEVCFDTAQGGEAEFEQVVLFG
jgi:hypothetical protein